MAVLLMAISLSTLLPWPRDLLASSDRLQPSDAALVFGAAGRDALTEVEAWRQQGLVRRVVVIDTPIRSHGLVVHWMDFVRWGLAPAAATPSNALTVVSVPDEVAQRDGGDRLTARTLGKLGVHSVLVPSSRLNSRLVRRRLAALLEPAGISVRVIVSDGEEKPSAPWWRRGGERRAVVTTWLELLVPGTSGP